MTGTSNRRNVDVVIVGASLSGAACAKRTTDAGLETIILEKNKLPRYKLCSGILSPRGHRFLLENFGPFTDEILHKPTFCRGVIFYFPSMLSMSMDFNGGPVPHLHRKYSDSWVIGQSGAEVHEQTTFTGLEDKGDYVDITAARGKDTVLYRARFLIGADGPISPVRHALYPDYARQIPWFIVGQKLHDIIECPLDEEYFHFWFHPALGHYTWSHARDGKQIVGVGFASGDNFNKRHAKVVEYLEKKHDVKLVPNDEGEFCISNFGPSLINRYIFGKGRVLITGQAAGFFNMIAEGMSCALHSGAIAGEAVIGSLYRNCQIQKIYRNMIASEVKKCTDQWNPFKIIFNKPHEADLMAALKKLKLSDRARIVKDLVSFIRIYSRFNWGRQILRQSIRRQLLGSYSTGSWL